MSEMERSLRMVAMAAVLCGAALGAPAAMAQEPLRGRQAGDLVLGFGVIGVLPQDGGRVDAIGGRPSPTDSASPQLDLTWFATPNLSLNVIAATTRHGVTVRNSALGDVDLGHVWILPPTVTAQFHPFPQSRFSPYAGAGINYSAFYGQGGATTAPVQKVEVKNSWGWALNVGVDYALSPRWAINLDVKKLFLRPDVSVNSGALTARADLDPWIVGGGVRYRF